jgi:hypothetical protein
MVTFQVLTAASTKMACLVAKLRRVIRQKLTDVSEMLTASTEAVILTV